MADRHNVFREVRVHVKAEKCATCIFRPGNLMRLEPGRVEDMVAQAKRAESVIVCHSTLATGKNAVCRGFFDRHATIPLRLAMLTQSLEEDP